ncbi:hypothetical protein MVEN_01421400 [Mycena venus]|uniref:F-box domain-containing protein n=1 Tax=Mycena venus TaxID=2733690 RepID=A0A8H7CVL6_9AGAR|nr:hypothetical protein MVEN_01421400 [Mycena venus]
MSTVSYTLGLPSLSPTTMPTLLQSLLRRRFTAHPAKTSPFSQLPLEIVFLIIDQFEWDILQLRKFCLVSRAWSSHAQSLLFRDVFVRWKTSARFLRLLQTSNELGRYISSLTVIYGHGSGWLGTQDEPSVLNAIAVEKMPNLRTLDISYLFFGGQRDTLHPAAAWGSISRLQMHFCRFDTTDTMVAFIASFPRLESLDVFQCYTLDVNVRAHEKPKQVRHGAIAMPAWHLKYLAFGEFPHNALINWMLAEPADLVVDHLRILTWSCLGCIGGGAGPGTPEVPLSIRACIALTTLSFSERSAYDLGRGIISMLLQVASPHLTTVSILINWHLNAGYLDIPWEEIEDMLTTDAFGHLKTVLINMWGGGGSSVMTPYEEAVLLMEDRLVILEARGLLQFKCVDWDSDDTAGRRLRAMPPRQTRPTLRRRISRKVAGWMGRGDDSSEYRNIITL